MKYFFIWIIRIYKRIKPLFYKVFSVRKLPVCRFYPTCSEYAIHAFETEKVIPALYRSVKRILKCHPFQPYTIDKHPNHRES